ILCLLDFVERLCGILPRPEGTLWFTGLLPKPATHRHELWETAYARTVDGRHFELLNTAGESELYRDGECICRFPPGLRLTTDRAGGLLGIEGLTSRPLSASLFHDGRELPFAVGPNQRLALAPDGSFQSAADPGMVLPSYG